MINHLSKVNTSLFIYVLLLLLLLLLFVTIIIIIIIIIIIVIIIIILIILIIIMNGPSPTSYLSHFLRLVRITNTVKCLLETPFRWLIT